MSADLYGLNPLNEAGERWNANVWYWSPLWSCVCELAEHGGLTLPHAQGQGGSGLEIDAHTADELVGILSHAIAEGDLDQWIDQWNTFRSRLDRQVCWLCEGTGIRTDLIGQNLGMPTAVLTQEQQLLLGRKSGWCNACYGEGMKDHAMLAYHFDEEAFISLVEFMEYSGGFRIL